MKLLPHILEEVLLEIVPKGTITGITDNGNGTYTFTAGAISSLLLDGDYISISGTPNFDTKKIKISNLTANSFDLNLQSGITISTLGEYMSLTPSFDFTETWVEYSENLDIQDKAEFIEKIPLFPAVYMPTLVKYQGLAVLTSFTVNDLNLAFIKFTKLDSNTRKRYQDDLPYLYDLYIKFIGELIRHKSVTNVTCSHTDDTFTEMKTNDAVSQIFSSIGLTFKTIEC